MLDIKNRRILVIGAGKSGIALLKLIKHLGGIPILTEQKKIDLIESTVLDQIKVHADQFEFGGHSEKIIDSADLIVLSPGTSIDSPFIKLVSLKGIPVMGEIEFSFQFTNVPVISVTGSNGKTTTVHLIHQILLDNGIDSQLCGNVGVPFAEQILEGKKGGYIVLEVSSFQMESLWDVVIKQNWTKQYPWLNQMRPFHPKIAVLLNLSENHLDRHRDCEEYFTAKFKMFQNQGGGDYALIPMEQTNIRSRVGSLKASLIDFSGHIEKIQGKTGKVNPNYAAVLAVSQILQLDESKCLTILKEFKGLEHRLEWVDKIDGVDYFNDSKSTTVEATRWALNQLKEPIILICGGRDKSLDFSVIKQEVRSKVRALIAIGEAKEKIENVFKGDTSVLIAEDLKGAVFKAKECARPGENVLLSPMCASFDMFRNYEDRGKTFKLIVKDLMS
ncbi:MAG: UDP-N-acetylmuramoyl-L-alanine--D-glutamate ligase [Candidatus Omnitrophica bacterium]|nr:UDP-N-acetylmuramoyl-L-alanine--D-glutamate ligase [Candidatus Omnitrophota bacterium]